MVAVAAERFEIPALRSSIALEQVGEADHFEGGILPVPAVEQRRGKKDLIVPVPDSPIAVRPCKAAVFGKVGIVEDSRTQKIRIPADQQRPRPAIELRIRVDNVDKGGLHSLVFMDDPRILVEITADEDRFIDMVPARQGDAFRILDSKELAFIEPPYLTFGVQGEDDDLFDGSRDDDFQYVPSPGNRMDRGADDRMAADRPDADRRTLRPGDRIRAVPLLRQMKGKQILHDPFILNLLKDDHIGMVEGRVKQDLAEVPEPEPVGALIPFL